MDPFFQAHRDGRWQPDAFIQNSVGTRFDFEGEGLAAATAARP